MFAAFDVMKREGCRVGTFAFGWAMVCGLLLQTWILPTLLPELHAGDGLLIGGDWVLFHQIALGLAERICEEGWQTWQLRPEGQAPAGIAAALYALTGIFRPIVMLPLNALLFGLAAVELYLILGRLLPERRMVGVVFFVLFPSSLQVYGQLHKDVFSILGILLVIHVFLLWPAAERRRIIGLAIRALLGLGLIWLVRPYLVDVVVVAWWIGAGLLGIVWLMQRKWSAARLVALVAIVIVQLVAMSWPGYDQVETKVEVCADKRLIDSLVCRIDAQRRAYVLGYPHAGSAIDVSQRFYGLTDVLSYLPRAVQVGLLAPFPSMWFEDGAQPGGRWMRLASMMEMLIAYIGMVGVLFGLWIARDRWEKISLIAILLAMIVIYVLVIPNVGTLYRMRLAPWHVLLGWGWVVLITYGKAWRARS